MSGEALALPQFVLVLCVCVIPGHTPQPVLTPTGSLNSRARAVTIRKVRACTATFRLRAGEKAAASRSTGPASGVWLLQAALPLSCPC